MLKIRIGDNVKVRLGKDSGKEGKIEKIFPVKKTVLIPDVNKYKKHVKGFGDQKGGIYELPRPLPIAAVSLICPKCKKVTRVGFKIIDNQKLRICKKCGKEIDTK